MFLLFRLLLDPVAAEGGGNPTPAPAPAPAPSAEEGFKALLAKSNNDAAALAARLFEENHKLRTKNATLRTKTAPDGSTILTGDDAAAWSQYKALGKPDELKSAREERDALKEASVKLARGQLNSQAAEVAGFRESVLSDLLTRDSLNVKVEEVQVNGKPARVAHVIHKDAAGKETVSPLSEYAKKHWPDYLPALSKAVTTAANLGTPTRQAQTTANPPGLPERRRLHGTGSAL